MARNRASATPHVRTSTNEMLHGRARDVLVQFVRMRGRAPR
jgi:hypothetical protein